MHQNQTGGRQLKKKIQKLLLQKNFEKGMAEISYLPARKVVNPLFSLLHSLDETLKWQAVIAMGAIVADLAEDDLESARVIMRRFIWNLNDESGGIGWGCPEAMGEIMAQSEKLAEKYWCILISYIRPDGNFLEHEALQRGVLWAVGRLAHARPQLLKDSADFLLPYMQAKDAFLRGLSAWAAGALAYEKTGPMLTRLIHDHSRIKIFRDRKLVECSVGEVAQEALVRSQAKENLSGDIN